MYINKVKQMNDMSYTLEDFDQDKETLMHLIADCEELELRETSEKYFIKCDEFAQDKYTVWHEFSYLHCQRLASSCWTA